MQYAKPANPLAIWTGPPPAKSRAPRAQGVPTAATLRHAKFFNHPRPENVPIQLCKFDYIFTKGNKVIDKGCPKEHKDHCR